MSSSASTPREDDTADEAAATAPARDTPAEAPPSRDAPRAEEDEKPPIARAEKNKMGSHANWRPDEVLYRGWFPLADDDADGRVTGADAVRFFGRSGLPKEILARVWQLADANRQGFLGPEQFVKALRVIAMAQSASGGADAKSITADALAAFMARDDDDDDANKGEPLPLAKLEGVDATGYTNRLESIQHEVQKDKGAFYLTLVPIRPRRRGERRSLRTFAVVSLRPGSLAFNPRPYDAFQLQLTPLNSTPTFARVERPKAMNKQRAAERDAANGNHGKKNRMSAKTATSIVDSLKELYKTKVRPVEEALKFGSFYSPLLTDGDFEGKPNVLLLGQYSTGKTTFIKHLLGRDYPGSNIGPEPTTDRFVVVMHGHENRTTPGQTLAVQSDKPYTGLTAFGSSFLSKFEASQCDAKILEEVSIVDTPGVLSGEKQRIDRGYSLVNVCEWFASRSDVILLLFDPHKLDISDEFKAVISSLRGHDDKVRVVLNKADQVSAQQLMRVYGALMWSLGKVFMTPEVCKVYVGSFNDKPPVTTNNVLGEELFMKEHEALKKDLLDIPQRSCDRKVNEFVKRVRAGLTHARIVTHLKKQMPAMMGHESKQKKLLGRIEEEFTKCVHEYTIARGDLPNPKRFRDIMKDMEIWKFPKIDKKAMKALEEVLTVDIPAVMKKFDNPF